MSCFDEAGSAGCVWDAEMVTVCEAILFEVKNVALDLFC